MQGGTSLRGSHLPTDSRLEFNRADLVQQDLSERHIDSFIAVASRFTACKFDRLRVDDARFAGGIEVSEYIDCSFDGAILRAPIPGPARFVRCSFREVALREWYCRSTAFLDCVFTGVIRDSYFNGSHPESDGGERIPHEFSGNDFQDAELINVAFRTGVDLSAQLLPNGDGYLVIPMASTAVGLARSTLREWPAIAREDGERFLDALEFESSGGQVDLFLRRADYDDWPIAEKMLRLITEVSTA
jgi:hypothetical protein